MNKLKIIIFFLCMPFLALYMWIMHPKKCIEEGIKMWKNRND